MYRRTESSEQFHVDAQQSLSILEHHFLVNFGILIDEFLLSDLFQRYIRYNTSLEYRKYFFEGEGFNSIRGNERRSISETNWKTDLSMCSPKTYVFVIFDSMAKEENINRCELIYYSLNNLLSVDEPK